MAQLPYIEPEDADPITKEVYAKAQARFEMVLNIFKITGNAPEIGAKMWEIFFEILKDGCVEWKTKELLILKTTKMGECLYCVTQHETVSTRLGIPAEKQVDLVGDRYRTSPHFDEAERAILDLNVALLTDPQAISQELWSRIKKHWDDAQIVEILVTIGAYLQVSKFGDAMGVELEPVFHGQPLRLFAEEPPKSPAAARHVTHFQHLPSGTAR